MAKSPKDSRISKAKSRSAAVSPKRAAVAKKAPVRSATPTAKAKAKPAARSAAAPQPAKAKRIEKAAPAKAPESQRPRSIAFVAAALLPLRADERKAVEQTLRGKATLLEASPRARDAVIYSRAALASAAPVLVASPIASELFAHATALGLVDVIALGAFVDKASRAASLRRIQRGGALLVVVDPASLFASDLQQAVAKVTVALIGVAGAHACSEHAHELSPAYLSVRDALRGFAAPVLATCTRTTARVVEQAAEALSAAIVTARPSDIVENAEVLRPSERRAALMAAISSYGAPGIVLTATSQEADAVYSELRGRGIACERAHAGMAPAERAQALARFVDPRQQLVLVTQSPHANASGLAGAVEAAHGLESAAPRDDLRFLVHYQAPLFAEQLFEDAAWLPEGAASLVLADSSDAALVQAILAQQRIKPASIEAMAYAVSQLSEDRPAAADTLALRAGTSRRSAERVLGALADRSLIIRDSGQISRKAAPEQLVTEGRLLGARFAALRSADTERAEAVAQYVTSRHGSAPSGATAARSVRV